MSHLYLDTRRLLATGTILLASALQLSGSDPAPESRQLRTLELSSVAFEGDREHCAQCLTEQQVKSLASAPHRLQRADAIMPSHAETAIQQAFLAADDLFYNPGREVGSSIREGLAGEIGPGERSPPLRPATSSDVTLTSWPIPQSVFFIYRSMETGEAPRRRVPIATAFVLSVPTIAHRAMARFLVTARHVVDPEWAHCSDRNPVSIEIGLNRSNGGVGFETISLDNTRAQHYFVPADGTSDIAIIRLDEQLIPDLETYKLDATPFSLLPTEFDLHTMTGTRQVVTASLREQPQTGINAYPMSGINMLSSTLNRSVNIRCGSNPIARPLDVWLIDGSVQQGVGGAPVYTSLVREGQTTPTTVLVGVQAIAWPDRGVAGITPSPALAELVQTALRGRSTQADFYRGVAP